MSRLTRTALAAFAAAGVIAATGVVGVVSAAAADTVQTRSPETHDPRLPVVNGSTLTYVKAGETRGPAGGFLTTKAACENYATNINESIESGLKDLYGGKMADASTKFGEAVRIMNEGEAVGCTFV